MPKKIRWQKYEDVLNKQINHPFLKEALGSLYLGEVQPEEEDSYIDDFGYNDEYQAQSSRIISVPVPIPQDLAEEVNLISNFDCWIGHTNFNITEPVIKKLKKIPGVEALRICSRYRFFIGVAEMFDSRQTRQDINDILTLEESDTDVE